MEAALLLAFASDLCAGTLALTVACYERRSGSRWAFAVGMVLLGAESILGGLSGAADSPPEMLYWENWRLLALSLLPGAWLWFSLSFARGNYRETIAAWRWLLIAAWAVPIALACSFSTKLAVSFHRTASGRPWMLDLSFPGLLLCTFFVLSSVVVLVNLERTFRAAVGAMRWRIKYLMLGVMLLFAVRTYSGSQELLFQAATGSLAGLNSDALLVACALMACSLLRAGHLEAQVYPSRFVLHHSLTAVGAGLYFMAVVGIVRAATLLHGSSGHILQSFLILLALTLLALLLLSERVRLQTRLFVTRHFQRPQYDYRTVWRVFTERTTRQVEPRDLCEAVVKMVSDLFQALSVTLWVVDNRKEGFVPAASSSVAQTEFARLKLDLDQANNLIAALTGRPAPVDIDGSQAAWAGLLRQLHPEAAPNGGQRICAPLVARDELLGVLMLGDRVGGAPYSTQDLDLLKSVSEQVAASLLNVQLSQRLAQARQLEAFQTMSAFFVHDLKNTASTLSLMLQNLPVHFDDPRFREDALRGVSRTVNHINELISRLSLLRQELAVKAVDADLNELVADVLNGFERTPRTEVVKELRPLPKVRVDPAQIRNVVTNLVLNARDAVAKGGRILVETSQRNGWVVLAVADNGCGMSADFVQRLLFRPFQTTKKDGIGIGMFQCKMIIEAHHGKIEVESEPGHGTAFRVLLPVQ
jgi:putative PEP-CTERM system histidine kinase